MPVYQRQGRIPRKRHIQFRQANGGLFHEELVGTQGFSGVSALVYHLHPPTIVKEREAPYSVAPKIAVSENLQAFSFKGFDLPPAHDYLVSRTPLFLNQDLCVGLAAPMTSMTDYFFKNADADEILFVHQGSGQLRTMYGNVDFEYGDYIVIPRGTIYLILFKT